MITENLVILFIIYNVVIIFLVNIVVCLFNMKLKRLNKKLSVKKYLGVSKLVCFQNLVRDVGKLDCFSVEGLVESFCSDELLGSFFVVLLFVVVFQENSVNVFGLYFLDVLSFELVIFELVFKFKLVEEFSSFF